MVYDGIKHSGWINPADLANYDIVLTDYNVLKSELYYSTDTRRHFNFRHSPKCIHPMTPLTMVNWWRVCLDEAQMIEAPINRSSQMVKLLPGILLLKIAF